MKNWVCEMNIIEIAQSLVPQLQLVRAIEDRKRNSRLGLVLLNDQLDHLAEDHDFRKMKISIKDQQEQSGLLHYVSIFQAFMNFFWKILQVISWTIVTKRQETSKQEFVILKGFGFQQLNPYFPPEEIVKSLPVEVLQTEKKENVDFILISPLKDSKSSGVFVTRDIFRALLFLEKPSIKYLFRFLVHANLLGFIALLKPEVRKFIIEIPSALLLANFEPKSKFLSLVDTQGSFENLDLLYYVTNNSLGIKSTMIHYSESGMPFTKTQLEANLFVQHYEFAPVNSHVVWTKEYADFFNSRSGNKNFLALGPQVFRSSKFTEGTKEPNLFRLAVFDETPSLHDEPYEHMREEAGLAFLDALQNLWESYPAAQPNRLEICFKQKRRNLGFHSRTYLMRLEALSTKGVIQLLPWHTNPFEMVSNSDSVLTVLGASPALIGRHLRRPTAYGYFGALELGQSLVNYDIPVIVNHKELIEWILLLAGRKN